MDYLSLAMYQFPPPHFLFGESMDLRLGGGGIDIKKRSVRKATDRELETNCSTYPVIYPESRAPMQTKREVASTNPLGLLISYRRMEPPSLPTIPSLRKRVVSFTSTLNSEAWLAEAIQPPQSPLGGVAIVYIDSDL